MRLLYIPTDSNAVVAREVPYMLVNEGAIEAGLCQPHEPGLGNPTGKVYSSRWAAEVALRRRGSWKEYFDNPANGWVEERGEYRFASDDGKKVAMFGRVGTHTMHLADGSIALR